MSYALVLERLMNNVALISVLSLVEPVECLAALVLIARRRHAKDFPFVTAFLAVRLVALCILIPLLFACGPHGLLSPKLGYELYFWVYWPSYALEAMLGFGIIHGLYRLAMAPLPGLQRLGTIMFRWAGGIAVALAVSVAIGPHQTSSWFISKFVTQLQQTQSVLTLCMLLFVALASKPMGISHRSKIFGTSLGLGLLAATDLVASRWISHFSHMGSIYNVVNGFSICLTFAIWIAYFAMPEPKRRMIVLPTTSPFLRWNQISQVLGDEPGFVAIGEVTPEMFAPAEIEIMLRASAKISSERTDAERVSAVR